MAKRALWKAPRVFELRVSTLSLFFIWKLHCCVVSYFITVIPLFCSEQALDWRIHRGMADSRGLVSFKCLHDNNDFTAWSFRLLWPKCLAVFLLFCLNARQSNSVTWAYQAVCPPRDCAAAATRERHQVACCQLKWENPATSLFITLHKNKEIPAFNSRAWCCPSGFYISTSDLQELIGWKTFEQKFWEGTESVGPQGCAGHSLYTD